ncbi:MAG: sigma-70 family RNA polymerase sigma factor [Clostridium sp.]|nr:MAG: sigma-70 family RNA polymerase sigma factor [Clostridium sp.]
MSAREEIISNNMKLVYYLVHKSGFDNTEDNYQIGLIGLIRAVDTFDIYSSYSFSTYAAKCIKNELNMYYRSYYKEKKLSIFLDAPNYKTSNEPLIEYISDGIDITSNVDSKSF